MSEAGRDPSMPIFNPRFAVYLRKALVSAVEIYRAAVRSLAALDDAALQERFLAAFASWYDAGPDGDRALNEVSAEYLLRKKPAPLELVIDKVCSVIAGRSEVHKNKKSLDREPLAVIAIGRVLFAPFVGGLLSTDRDDD